MSVFTRFIKTKQKAAWSSEPVWKLFVFMRHHLETVLLPAPLQQSEKGISDSWRNETKQVLRWDRMLPSLQTRAHFGFGSVSTVAICNTAGETSIVLNYYGLLE